jgi:hypothetical protein
MNTFLIILKLICAVLLSGILILEILSYSDILFPTDYLYKRFGFDWEGLIVVTLFFIPTVIGLFYLVK